MVVSEEIGRIKGVKEKKIKANGCYRLSCANKTSDVGMAMTTLGEIPWRVSLKVKHLTSQKPEPCQAEGMSGSF